MCSWGKQIQKINLVCCATSPPPNYSYNIVQCSVQIQAIRLTQLIKIEHFVPTWSIPDNISKDIEAFNYFSLIACFYFLSNCI